MNLRMQDHCRNTLAWLKSDEITSKLRTKAVKSKTPPEIVVTTSGGANRTLQQMREPKFTRTAELHLQLLGVEITATWSKSNCRSATR